jgi:hypothetical protein
MSFTSAVGGAVGNAVAEPLARHAVAQLNPAPAGSMSLAELDATSTAYNPPSWGTKFAWAGGFLALGYIAGIYFKGKTKAS